MGNSEAVVSLREHSSARATSIAWPCQGPNSVTGEGRPRVERPTVRAEAKGKGRFKGLGMFLLTSDG